MKLKDLRKTGPNACLFVREDLGESVLVEDHYALNEVLHSCEGYTIKHLDYVIFSTNGYPEVTLAKRAFEQVKKFYKLYRGEEETAEKKELQAVIDY